MEVVLQLSCPCRPGFCYKNDLSLKAHRRTKLHTTWEALQENKNDKVRSKDFENQLERLKRQKDAVETSLLTLMAQKDVRIAQLEHDIQYWKNLSSGVYL